MITLGQYWALLYADGLLLNVRWCLDTVHFRYLLVMFKRRAPIKLQCMLYCMYCVYSTYVLCTVALSITYRQHFL